jgi:hypothetical protein
MQRYAQSAYPKIQLKVFVCGEGYTRNATERIGIKHPKGKMRIAELSVAKGNRWGACVVSPDSSFAKSFGRRMINMLYGGRDVFTQMNDFHSAAAFENVALKEFSVIGLKRTFAVY